MTKMTQAALSASIMLLGCCFVNASQPIAKSKTSALIIDLQNNGIEDVLANIVGPNLNLKKNAPVKYVLLKPNKPSWTKKFGDLVLEEDGEGKSKKPFCFVFIEHHKDGNEVTVTNYRFDLDGNLVAGYILKGRDDDNGKPIQGSATIHPIDIAANENIKKARRELDFWLSGKYKKFLSPQP